MSKLISVLTPAQQVTKICYTEETRILDFNCACEDLEDLVGCIEIIRSYNEFDSKCINEALKRYCNNSYTYTIGRENSPVLYIESSSDAFEVCMNKIATMIGQDEFGITGDEFHKTARFWWD